MGLFDFLKNKNNDQQQVDESGIPLPHQSKSSLFKKLLSAGIPAAMTAAAGYGIVPGAIAGLTGLGEGEQQDYKNQLDLYKARKKSSLDFGELEAKKDYQNKLLNLKSQSVANSSNKISKSENDRKEYIDAVASRDEITQNIIEEAKKSGAKIPSKEEISNYIKSKYPKLGPTIEYHERKFKYQKDLAPFNYDPYISDYTDE
jgi:hypothetical protein